MPLDIYGLRGGHGHTHKHTHKHTQTLPHESDFKKPGAYWPAAGVHLVYECGGI